MVTEQNHFHYRGVRLQAGPHFVNFLAKFGSVEGFEKLHHLSHDFFAVIQVMECCFRQRVEAEKHYVRNLCEVAAHLCAALEQIRTKITLPWIQLVAAFEVEAKVHRQVAQAIQEELVVPLHKLSKQQQTNEHDVLKMIRYLETLRQEDLEVKQRAFQASAELEELHQKGICTEMQKEMELESLVRIFSMKHFECTMRTEKVRSEVQSGILKACVEAERLEEERVSKLKSMILAFHNILLHKTSMEKDQLDGLNIEAAAAVDVHSVVLGLGGESNSLDGASVEQVLPDFYAERPELPMEAGRRAAFLKEFHDLVVQRLQAEYQSNGEYEKLLRMMNEDDRDHREFAEVELVMSDALIDYLNACHFKLSRALASALGKEPLVSPYANRITTLSAADGQATSVLVRPLTELVTECGVSCSSDASPRSLPSQPECRSCPSESLTPFAAATLPNPEENVTKSTPAQASWQGSPRCPPDPCFSPFYDPTTAPVSPFYDPTTTPVSHFHDPTTTPVSPFHDPTTAPVSPSHDPTTTPVSVFHDPTTTPVSPAHDPTTAPVSHFHDPTSAPVSPFHDPTTTLASPFRDSTSAPVSPFHDPTTSPASPFHDPTTSSVNPFHDPTTAPVNPFYDPTNAPVSPLHSTSTVSLLHSTSTSLSNPSHKPPIAPLNPLHSPPTAPLNPLHSPPTAPLSPLRSTHINLLSVHGHVDGLPPKSPISRPRDLPSNPPIATPRRPNDPSNHSTRHSNDLSKVIAPEEAPPCYSHGWNRCHLPCTFGGGEHCGFESWVHSAPHPPEGPPQIRSLRQCATNPLNTSSTIFSKGGFPSMSVTFPVGRVIQPYKARTSQELSINIGDKIYVVDCSDKDWWKGEIEGKIGFFPSFACAIELLK